MWRATIFTLFPEMFPGPLGVSLSGEALSREHLGHGRRAISARMALAGIEPSTIHRPGAAPAW